MIGVSQMMRMSRLIIGAALALASLACANVGQTDSGVEYLTETVAPCQSNLSGWTDPCPPFKPPDERSSGGTGDASMMFVDPMTIDDIILHQLFTADNGVTPAHIVVRGMWIPGSIRCDMYPTVHGYANSHPRPSWWLETVCFWDFGVSDYIVGKGPDRITLRAGSKAGHAHEHSSDADLARWSEEAEDEIIRTLIADDERREIIFSLAPDLYNVAIAVWTPRIAWEIERDAEGEPIVVSGWLEYAAHVGIEITQEYIDHLTWPLKEFERRAAVYEETRPKNEGAGPYREYRILSDIYEIHPFYAEDLKPPYEFSGPISVPPPPAPGEPHSYPPLVALEPASETEAFSTTEQTVASVGSR